MRRFGGAAVALLVVASVSCAGGERRIVDVFAAASLTDALTEIAADFEAANPGVEVRLNLAGSSSLREQILDGAEADVFVSANMAIMEQLVDAGAIAGKPTVAARNVLSLAVPVDNPGRVEGLEDLSRPELLVGLCARGVPCGDLALELLERAGVEAQADTAEPDVRALAQRLADRELDVALIYASDVVADPQRLRTVPVDTDLPTTEYPIAAVDVSDADALAFIDHVLGTSGRSILQRWGFARP